MSAQIDAKSHRLHLFDFSPLCVFNATWNCHLGLMQSRTGCTYLMFLHYAFLKCLLKMSAWINAKSYWLHLFDFSQMCVYKMPPQIVTFV